MKGRGVRVIPDADFLPPTPTRPLCVPPLCPLCLCGSFSRVATGQPSLGEELEGIVDELNRGVVA